MRALAAVALVLAAASCAAPAQAPAEDAEDLALLWSARVPGAIEGPVVLETRDIAYADIPQVAGEDASKIRGLTLIGGAVRLRRREVLGTEQLVVTAPESRWVAASGALQGPVPQYGAPKLEVVLGLERGSSAAATFHVERRVLGSEPGDEGSPPTRRITPSQLAMIALDVVWPSSSEVPIITATVARLDRAKAAMPD